MDPASLYFANEILTQQLIELRENFAAQIASLRLERDSLRIEMRAQEARFAREAARMQEALERGLAASVQRVEELTTELERMRTVEADPAREKRARVTRRASVATTTVRRSVRTSSIGDSSVAADAST